MVDRIMPPPKHAHILLPKTHVSIISYGKKDFVNVSKLRNLRWGNYHELSGYTQCNRRVLIRGMQKVQSKGKNITMTEIKMKG